MIFYICNDEGIIIMEKILLAMTILMCGSLIAAVVSASVFTIEPYEPYVNNNYIIIEDNDLSIEDRLEIALYGDLIMDCYGLKFKLKDALELGLRCSHGKISRPS